MVLNRYALVTKTKDGWVVDTDNFLLIPPPGPEPWSTEDGENYHLPVERDFRDYDEELWLRYLGGYHVEGDKVIERFRYEPVPNFNNILLARAMGALNDAWQPMLGYSIVQLLELQGTIFEAQECLRGMERGQNPERGEFMLLEAMIGDTYEDRDLGTLTVETVPEAARVTLKAYHVLRRTWLSAFKEKRLKIQRAVAHAATPEEAAELVERFIEEVKAFA